MSNRKLKTQTIDLPLYKCQLMVMYNCSSKEASEYLRKKYNLDVEEDMMGNSGVCMTFDEEPWRVIWVRTLKKTPEDIGRLAHEVTHSCVRILEHKGVPYDSYRNADESLAYMIDYFMREKLEEIQEMEDIVSTSQNINRRTKAGRQHTEELLDILNQRARQLIDEGKVLPF